MIDDEKIIDLFFERSEQGIRELDSGTALCGISVQDLSEIKSASAFLLTSWLSWKGRCSLGYDPIITIL